jgi:dihydrofolate reductase
MANIIYIATSLDGYIARNNGSIDWLAEIPNPENSDYGFSDFLDRIDAIVMGRNTFETVVGFGQWPYNKPVFVLSSTMKEVPAAYTDKAEIVSGDIMGILETLNQKNYRNLYIDGGATIQSFVDLDLIDEMIITRVPILLGKGIPLFKESDREIKFTLENSERISKELVKNTYLKQQS